MLSNPLPRPLVIAHRGASGYRPEHTASAYSLAIELGSDAVEPDLVSSKDGVLVIRHENEISLSTDVAERAEFADRRATKLIDGVEVTGWFTEDFLWSELQTLRARERMPQVRPANAVYDGLEGILSFDDLLDLLDASGGAIMLVAEIKHPTYFASIGLPLDELFAAAVARRERMVPLIVESFELSVLQSIRALGVEAGFTYLVESFGSPVDRPEHSYAWTLTDEGLAATAEIVDGVSIDKRALLQTDDAGRTVVSDVIERAHAVGLQVFCWTLRAENRFLGTPHQTVGAAHELGDWASEFRLLMQAGLDGVFADQPDLAVAARGWLDGAVVDA